MESLAKCGDFLYSGRGLNTKSAMGDRQEAQKCYKKAAECGSSRAMNALALMLESTNSDEALKWYLKAHKQGNVDSTVNMAILYLKVSHHKQLTL